MVDLFADIPETTIESTLQMIKKNLNKVELYGGHTLRRHTDVQVLALKKKADTGRYPVCYFILGYGSGAGRGTGNYEKVL